MRSLSLLLVSLFLMSRAEAQSIGGHFSQTKRDEKNMLGSAISWDPIPSLDLTYGRAIRRAALNPRPLLLFTSLHAPLFLLQGADSFTTQLGAGWFFLTGPLTLRGVSSVSAQSFDNNISRGASLRYELSLQPGYLRGRWFFGLDLSYRAAFLSYLQHSEAYRAQFPGVVDGWYTNDTAYYMASPCVAHLLPNGIALSLQVGLRRAQSQAEDTGPFILPLVASLGASYHF